MKNKAVFLDRDGTINVDHGYVHRIEDFEFLPGVIEALKLLQSKGYLLIIITNQSGIARGYYTEEDYNKLTEYMLDELKKEGIDITDVLYCPHLPDAKIEKYRVDCDCRKPKTGLFQKAIQKWNINISKSIAVGDKARDLSVCETSSCKGFLITTAIITDTNRYENICKVESLHEMVKHICASGE